LIGTQSIVILGGFGPYSIRSAYEIPPNCEIAVSLYEIKWDGYRAQAIHSNLGLQLLSRRTHPFNSQFPSLLPSLQKLPKGVVIDGEIVALDGRGKPNFNLLQNYRQHARLAGSVAKIEEAEGMSGSCGADSWLGTIFLSQGSFQMLHHLGHDGWTESKSAFYKPDFGSYPRR
jgi:ATP dependent DNA ligase domain